MAEEFLTFKHGDNERPIPAQALKAISEAMGWKNERAALNALQIAADAKDYYDEAKQLYQVARRQPQQYGEPTHQQYRPNPQQNGYQQQPQGEAEPDPIQMLREIRQEQARFNEYVSLQQQREQAQLQSQAQALIRQTDDEYRKFASDLAARGVPKDRIPNKDTLLSEAEMMGMFESNLSVGDMYRRVYRMQYADDLVDFGIQSQMQRLRDPKAQVTVPAARQSPQAPPPAQTPEAILGNMTWGEGLQSIPETRR